MTALELIWSRSAADIEPALWNNGFAPPLEGRWWYETLERSQLEDQFAFYYAVVRQNGRTIAFAPAFLMDVPITPMVPEQWQNLFQRLGHLFPSLLTQRTFFYGSPFSDEGGIGILPDADRSTILDCLQKGAEDKARQLNAHMLVWKDFPQNYDSDLQKLAAVRGLFRLVSFPGTVVDLPAGSQNAYLASLKSGHRHNLKKKWRRSEALVALEMEVVQHPSPEQIDAIFALFWQTYEKAETKFERLNRRFFEVIAQRSESYFVTLKIANSSQMVGFMLCFAQGDFVINKFIGLDYNQPKEWFLYFRLWQAAVAFAQSRGARTLQSGQTGYKIKLESGHRLTRLTNYARHQNRLLHWLFQRIAKDVNWQSLDENLAVYLKAHPDAGPTMEL